uniref:GH10 domain-containing protein n=1 Tax=Panagrellus redivivus TaxID=6233 RepID=A0A7E4VCI7_PANRE
MWRCGAALCTTTSDQLVNFLKTQKPGFRLVFDQLAADSYWYIDLMKGMKAQLPYVVGNQEMAVTHVTMKCWNPTDHCTFYLS